MLIAVPLGAWLGHRGVGGVVAINIANIGRAIPIYALLVLAVQIFGITSPRGFGWTGSFVAFVPLVLLGIPPMLTNSYIGVRDVGDELVDAARGMGLSDGEILRRVEIPVAMPLIMAGIRTAMVGIVATATLASFTGVDTLATPIYIGLNTSDNVAVFGGARARGAARGRRRPRARRGAASRRLAGTAAAASHPASHGRRYAPLRRLGCAHRIPFRTRSTPCVGTPDGDTPASRWAPCSSRSPCFSPRAAAAASPVRARRRRPPPRRPRSSSVRRTSPARVLLSQLYGQALAAKGFEVSYKNLGPTEVTYPALKSGADRSLRRIPGHVAHVPEGHAHRRRRGDERRRCRTKVATDNIKASSASNALDVNGFYVTKDTATKYNLTKLSDLTAVAPQLTFGGPAECQDASAVPRRHRAVALQPEVQDGEEARRRRTDHEQGVEGRQHRRRPPVHRQQRHRRRLPVAHRRQGPAAGRQRDRRVAHRRSTAPRSTAVIDAVNAKLDTAAYNEMALKIFNDKEDPTDVAKDGSPTTVSPDQRVTRSVRDPAGRSSRPARTRVSDRGRAP